MARGHISTPHDIEVWNIWEKEAKKEVRRRRRRKVRERSGGNRRSRRRNVVTTGFKSCHVIRCILYLISVGSSRKWWGFEIWRVCVGWYTLNNKRKTTNWKEDTRFHVKWNLLPSLPHPSSFPIFKFANILRPLTKIPLTEIGKFEA